MLADVRAPRRAVQHSQHGSTIVLFRLSSLPALYSIPLTRIVQKCGIPCAALCYLIREHVDEALDSIDLYRGKKWSILFSDKLVHGLFEPPSITIVIASSD